MTPYYQDAHVTIYHADCREVLPDVRADAFVTDPPYVFGLASTAQEGKAGGWGDLMNNAAFFASLLRQMQGSLRSAAGAVWMFNSWRSFPVLARAAYEARWPIESLLVWDKKWIGPGGQRGLRPSYELVAPWCAGDFGIPNRGTRDIWAVQASAHKPTGHPAEKPLDLLLRLLEATPVEIVCDPFMGSGTTLRAAKNLGRRAIGIEIEERYCEIAAERCRQEVLELGA